MRAPTWPEAMVSVTACVESQRHSALIGIVWRFAGFTRGVGSHGQIDVSPAIRRFRGQRPASDRQTTGLSTSAYTRNLCIQLGVVIIMTTSPTQLMRTVGLAALLALLVVNPLPLSAQPFVPASFAAAQNSAQSPAETAAPRPSFEVASIKPNDKDSPCCTYGGKEPGGYRIRNISLKSMISEAYELPENQISGGPSWIGSEHYDIEAKMSDSQKRAIEKLSGREQSHQIDLMLQSLLAARFGLTVDHQPKEFAGYVLMVAKGGSKLHMSGTPEPPASKHSDNNGGSFLFAFQAKDSPLHNLVVFLSSELGRPVIDETGLNGNYDINLQVPLNSQTDVDPQTDVDTQTDVGSAIMTTLQEQLGLTLKSQKVSADMIVITHIERPTEN